MKLTATLEMANRGLVGISIIYVGFRIIWCVISRCIWNFPKIEFQNATPNSADFSNQTFCRCSLWQSSQKFLFRILKCKIKIEIWHCGLWENENKIANILDIVNRRTKITESNLKLCIKQLLCKTYCVILAAVGRQSAKVHGLPFFFFFRNAVFLTWQFSGCNTSNLQGSLYLGLIENALDYMVVFKTAL